ncbi:glycosyltransferase family 4 protein [Congzhengia sp.]|uniref:glycosyltransferase family 4 protein n=1 Tax=Congzhengia sp. TaxID=2944168 RepID=UPI0030778371
MEKEKSVIIFSREYPPNLVGGTAVVACSTARGLRKLGYHVTVVTSQNKDVVINEDGVDIISIGQDIYQQNTGMSDSNIKYHMRVLAFLKDRVKISPDIVLVPDLFSYPEAYLFAKKNSIPIINILLQDFRKMVIYDRAETHKVADGVNGFPKHLLEIEKKSLLYSDANVFISKALYKSICDFYNIDERRCHIVYLGIDKEELTEAQSQSNNILKKEICAEDRKLIMSIGRFVPVKGFDKLIEAFSLIHSQAPESFLCILGRGPEREYLEDLIVKLNLKNSIKLLYEPDRKKVVSLMNTCDIAVVPSLWESFCYVAAEFMGLEKPIVVSGVDSLNELIIHNECGLICPVEENQNKRQININNLAENISILYNDEDLSRSLGKKAKERAYTIFNNDRFALELSNVINSYLGKK